MDKSELKVKCAAILNQVRLSFNAPFTIKDLDARLSAKDMPYRKKTINLLLDKQMICEVREDKFGKYYELKQPVHHSFFSEIVDKDPRNSESDVSRFLRLLLDVQFYQRKERQYSLEALLKEYSIYTFPKRSIPDLSNEVLDEQVASKLYEKLVLSYRRNIEAKRSTQTKSVTVDDIDLIAKYLVLVNSKLDAIIKHFSIEL